MTEIMENPYPLIVMTSLVLGFASGVIMHRADFCIAGMFRNLFMFRHTFMLRALIVLIAASTALFELGRNLGIFKFYPFPLLGSPSLANVCGGLLFGIGMVLAGGCVVGTLYKMGAGNLLSAVAFAGLIFGSALYAEIHPLWSSFARATGIFPGIVTVPQLFGMKPTLFVWLIVVGSLLVMRRWAKDGKWRRVSHAEGYLQPWLAAILLALIGTCSFAVVGMPLGITTAYAKLGAFLEQAFVPDHVASLPYYATHPLDYIPPFSTTRIVGGPGPSLDAIAAIQFPLIVGIVGGGLVSVLHLGEFRIYWKMPAIQYFSAFAGGLLMGLAARMSPACNLWHLLGGMPIMALQSILFVVGLIPGAWLGSLLLKHLILK